jgi:hypothetical protein
VDVTVKRDLRAGQRSPHPARIDVHVGELKQLYNAMDPAPFRERDLDPNAETFIADSARELGRDAPLELVVRLSRESATNEDLETLRQAVREHFGRCAAAERARLRRLFRSGRWSLLIGVLFVAAAIMLGDRLATLVGGDDYGRIIQESFAIGAWVALWRPLEIFLYDWWPIRAEARLFDRLAAMNVKLTNEGVAEPGMPAS